MIDAGDTFPHFSLPDEHGAVQTLETLKGERGVVLYIYPKDDTPGCTAEAKDFNDRLADFAAVGYRVVGVSKDSAASHCRFIDKYELGFPLLTDAEGDFLTAIGAWGEKKMYGRTSVGIIRSTFVVGADGNLEKVFRNVRAKGHGQRVLDAVS